MKGTIKKGDRIKLTKRGALSLNRACMRPRKEFKWDDRRGVVESVPKDGRGVRVLWDGRSTSDSLALPWSYIEEE
jgi:hypothetical protein